MDTEKIETQAKHEAAHVMARCPYRKGSPERAMWRDAMSKALEGTTLEEIAAAVEALEGDGTGEVLPPLVEGDQTEHEAPDTADVP